MGTVKRSVTVYIWVTSDENPGHASMEVEEEYISYWPTSEDSDLKDGIKNSPTKGNLNDFKLGITHKASFPSSYRVDRRLERKDADHKIEIHGLNVDAIKVRWLEFKDQAKRYNMQKRNCSTVIASFLELGSEVPYKKTPCVRINQHIGDPVARFFLKLRYLGQWVEMWTPYDVHLYALQIKSAKGFS
ncbi:hypothetical protein [Teredinibacter turnerae]|uniref:hypothetical protein n=1 Tax=Teredinibacter turnerae TaxID=2426 RepID=UPI00037B34BB|nr:hypothetical protein [Teredinibacter turnerae]